MARLNYALVSNRPSKTSIYRKSWKPKPKPYAKPAVGVGAAAVITTRKRLSGDIRSRAPAAARQEPIVRMDVDPAPRAHNFEAPAWNIDGPGLASTDTPKGITTSSTVGQPDHPNDVTDVIMFEDDYVELPSIIGGYDPEYGDFMQIDSIGTVATHDEDIPFNAPPLDVFAMLGYVPEFSEPMEVEWVGPSIPSGNPLAGTPFNPLITGPVHTQPDPSIFLPNAPIADEPYDPREPLFAPRPQVPQIVEDNVLMRINVNIPVPAYHVQPPAPKALNTPAVIPVQEQPIENADDHVELFNELFGDDGAEEDEEDAGAPEPPWTATGDERVEERGVNDDEEEDELEIFI